MKVLIPTAGIGSRLGDITQHINKAMLPIGSRPVISHIIDSYPAGTEFIVALGFRGTYIREYLDLVYPKVKFNFVEVDNFDGPGSGLGYTLKQCKPYIDGPFYFHANDTIVLDGRMGEERSADTMFLHAASPDPKKYRTVSFNDKDNHVVKIYDKTDEHLNGIYNYIGLAYIKDYKAFREYLDSMSVRIGESDYFIRRISEKKAVMADMVDRWYDIGNIEQFRQAQRDLSDFENLNKPNEAIYFHGTKVIKFSTDESFIKNRTIRAKGLRGMVPEITTSSRHFYTYDYIPGRLLSEELSSLEDFRHLLRWAQQNLWKSVTLDRKGRCEFENRCYSFYYDKTMDRIDLFYTKHGFEDHGEIINNIRTPSLTAILEKVDWPSVKQGVPVVFHGDFHFENILKTESGFMLLDWRQDFADELRCGDIYYDLAKLLHGLMVNHEIIRKGQFTLDVKGDAVKFDFHRKQSLIECEKYFYGFLKEKGFSADRTKILTALVFLNISSLHHYPYSHFLYYLGKSMLWEILR